MIYKQDETRRELLKGAELLYDAVRTTMGPKGRNVLVKDKFGNFSITHDGVTVARAVKSDDPSIQLGIDLIKEASKQMDNIGDGTTSVTVLTYHLIKELMDLVKAGTNPMDIKRQLDSLVDNLLAKVDEATVTIDHTFEAVYDVAKISAEDTDMARLIAELVVGTGYEGAITVSTQQGAETTTELIEGYVFPTGYASPHFATDKKTGEAILHKPVVLLVDGNVDSMQTYGPLLDDLVGAGRREILIIGDTIDPEMLSLLILNKVKGQFNATFVKNYLGVERLKDLAAVVGGFVFSANSEEELDATFLGEVEKVVVNDKETIIISGEARAKDIKDRVNALRAQNKKQPSKLLDEQIAALSGKVGTIKVGGVTDTDAQERKYRVDDAVAATRAALKGGIVAGGGVTLRDIAGEINTLANYPANEVFAAIKRALEKPEEILHENSGITPLQEFKEQKGGGVDVTTGRFALMLDAGIVDPAIVTKEVIRNAFSVAGIAITVGGAIVEPPITQEELTNLMKAAN